MNLVDLLKELENRFGTVSEVMEKLQIEADATGCEKCTSQTWGNCSDCSGPAWGS